MTAQHGNTAGSTAGSTARQQSRHLTGQHSKAAQQSTKTGSKQAAQQAAQEALVPIPDMMHCRELLQPAHIAVHITEKHNCRCCSLCSLAKSCFADPAMVHCREPAHSASQLMTKISSEQKLHAKSGCSFYSSHDCMSSDAATLAHRRVLFC